MDTPLGPVRLSFLFFTTSAFSLLDKIVRFLVCHLLCVFFAPEMSLFLL